MSNLLKCQKEELVVLSGKIPKDIKQIIRENPIEAYNALRCLKDNTNMLYDTKTELNYKNKYKLIDLFSGAGGMTAGFVASKRFEPVFANDFDKWSVASYNRNFGNHAVCTDINNLLENDSFTFPRCDIVIGGPPCQGFSLLNKNRKNDPRKQLWRAYMEVVRQTCPTAFVIENVPGLYNSSEYEEILKSATELGYKVEGKILNAADYGVPQRRKRTIIIGLCNSILPIHPEPTHQDIQSNRGNQFFGSLLPWETVRRAIGDLPEPVGTDIRLNEVPPLNLHFGRNPAPKSVLRYKCIPEGGNRFDLLRKRPDLTPNCWIKKKDGGTDLFGRLWWDKPSFTIRTEFFKPEKGRYLHPESNRPITHREAARLQSFADSFVFEGSKIEVAKQIGNAVPVLLAQRIAETVAWLMDKTQTKINSDARWIASNG